MRQVRFGSYSTVVTLAGMPNLFRRKSIRRYWRLWPPPWWRVVTCPLLLRPPVRRSGSSSVRSGVALVTSAKSLTERNRVAAVTGLNCRMPISALEHRDRVAVLQLHDRFLPGRAPADVPPVAALLRAHHEGPDIGDAHAEQLLDRLANLRLGRLDVHAERVFLARLVGGRRLLGHHRSHDESVQVRHRSPPPAPLPTAPAPRRPPSWPRARRTRSRPRSAGCARPGCCGPRGRRCATSANPPSAPAPCVRPHPACPAARRTAWSSAARTPARPPPARRPRAPARSAPTCAPAGAPSWESTGGSRADAVRTRPRRAASAAHGSSPAAPARCPSAATASDCRPRRSCASWSRPFPVAGWRDRSPPRGAARPRSRGRRKSPPAARSPSSSPRRRKSAAPQSWRLLPPCLRTVT